MKFPKKDHIHNLGAYINMLQTKIRVSSQFIFPLLVISSKKRVNNGKSDKTLNMETLLMKFPKKTIISIILEQIPTCYKKK